MSRSVTSTRRARRTAPRSRSSRDGTPRTRSRGARRTCSRRQAGGRAAGSRARPTEGGRSTTSSTTQMSIIRRSASGSATLPNAGLDAPAARELPVELVGDRRRARRRCPRASSARPGRSTSSTTNSGIATNRRIVSAFGSWRSGCGDRLDAHRRRRLVSSPVARTVTLPGFVNAHSHAFQRALRGRAAGGDFWAWRERDARRGGAADTRASVRDTVRAHISRDARGGVHGGRRVPLPRARRPPAPLPRRPRRPGSRSSASTSRTPAVGSSACGSRPWRRISTRSSACASDGVVVGLAPHSVRACPRDWLEEIGRYAEAEQPRAPRPRRRAAA